MPCVGFIHPLTRERVGFDAFDQDTTRNERPAHPPWAARLLAEKVRDDKVHADMRLTVTRCATCPRETFLGDTQPYHVDPERVYGRDRGTAQHEAADPYWKRVPGYDTKLEVVGQLFGVKLRGEIDVYREDGDGRILELIDSKYPSDFSVKFRSQQHGRAKAEHAFQLNCYRLLLPQMDGVNFDPDGVKLTVWDHACGKAAGPEPMAAPHMTEEALLALKPAQMDVTVREIVEMHMAAKAEYDKLSEEERRDPKVTLPLAARIPLFGQTSNWKCQYCDVEQLCNQLLRQYGTPGE